MMRLYFGKLSDGMLYKVPAGMRPNLLMHLALGLFMAIGARVGMCCGFGNCGTVKKV